MSGDQFDFLDEIADQFSHACNPGHGRCGQHGRRLSVSPALMRAKVARPAADSPAATASPPEAIAEAQSDPVLPRVVTSKGELLALLRARRDELGITHETLDALIGWSSGYTSKVLSPEPIKGLGERSLRDLLQALALGIVRIEFVEDPEQAMRMRPRWTKRLHPKRRPRRTRSALAGALLTQSEQRTLPSTTEDSNVESPPEFSPEA
jgi:hypothetical protein